MADRETLLKILDLARWAPSGDNTQPWRFEIVSDDHIAIHGHDTRGWCVYDFRGHASHIAHGALLETLRIAASRFGLEATWKYRETTGDLNPVFDVTLTARDDLSADPLLDCIETRSVQRRAMRTTPLDEEQRASIVAAAGPDFTLQFFDSFSDRHRIARLLWENAHIRLTCPEAYKTHKRVIEWNARYSTDKIPDQAVGADALTVRLMHWAMASWGRVQFMNKYLMGTVGPRVQLDYIPALACASHILLIPKSHPQDFQEFVKVGTVIQRIWLTAELRGLRLQPEMTPVIFNWYALNAEPVSSDETINAAVHNVSARLNRIIGNAKMPVFLARVGSAAAPQARSLRMPLDVLMAGEQ